MGFGVWGLGFGVWGLGFGVWGLGFGVWGLGFGVWGFRVQGLGYYHAAPQKKSGFRCEALGVSGGSGLRFWKRPTPGLPAVSLKQP